MKTRDQETNMNGHKPAVNPQDQPSEFAPKVNKITDPDILAVFEALNAEDLPPGVTFVFAPFSFDQLSRAYTFLVQDGHLYDYLDGSQVQDLLAAIDAKSIEECKPQAAGPTEAEAREELALIQARNQAEASKL